jgi:TonB family protein
MKIAERLDGNKDEADVVDLDLLYCAAITGRNAGVENKSRRAFERSYASLLVAGAAVVTTHTAALSVLLHKWGQPAVQSIHEEEVGPHRATVFFVEPARAHDAAILPEMHLLSPTLDQTITNVTFEDPDADLVPGIIGPSSAPQPDLTVVVDPAPYALRAGLNTGEAVTVILAVEVLADGSAGQVIVVTGTGNSMIDAAAMEYARSLRWIPATMNRRAKVTRITFPVTLSL